MIKYTRVINLLNYEHDDTKSHGHESQPKAQHDKYHVLRPRANYGKLWPGLEMFFV